MKFWVTNTSQCSQETMDSWNTPHCEVVGFIDVDDDKFVFFRVRHTANLPPDDFNFVREELKKAGGTYWFGARLWIIEHGAISRVVEVIRAHFKE